MEGNGRKEDVHRLRGGGNEIKVKQRDTKQKVKKALASNPTQKSKES